MIDSPEALLFVRLTHTVITSDGRFRGAGRASGGTSGSASGSASGVLPEVGSHRNAFLFKVVATEY